jgi:hypothetical protein
MSLLQEGEVEVTETEPSDTSVNPNIEPAWWWDDNTPGSGDRPDFLPEKYKKVSDVAKAYKELEQRLGQAPNEYDFSKGEDWIDPDYEPFQDLAQYAKSKHVPQDVMDKMLESVSIYLNEFKPDLEEEKTKLGEKAKERLTLLNNWAKSNLSDKAFQALTSNMRTAEAIEALEEIRSKMMQSNTLIPTGNESAANSTPSVEQVKNKIKNNYQKYKDEPEFRQEIQGELKRALDAEELLKNKR